MRWYIRDMHVTVRLLLMVLGLIAIGSGIYLLWPDTTEAPTNNITGSANTSMQLTSELFTDGGTIPSEYTCDGDNFSPPLTLVDAPEETRSFALIMEDPDVPTQLRADGLFVHWVRYNIPASVEEIEEGDIPGTGGANTAGGSEYTGPCPPTAYEPREHRYIFTVYALDVEELPLPAGASKQQVLDAMAGHVLAEAALMGRYARVAETE